MSNINERGDELEDKQINWLDNQTILRNTRTIAFLIIILIAPALYFGIMENFTIESLLQYSFGGLIVFMTIVNFLTVMEIRTRAFEDELDFDTSIIGMENQVDDNAKIIRKDIPIAIEKLSKYNKTIQKSLDLQKTELYREKLNRKLTNLKIRYSYSKLLKKRLERKIMSVDNKIKNLQVLVEKRFKPYKLNDLITAQTSGKRIKVGNDELERNPKKVPILKSILKMPFKGFTMSIGGLVGSLFLVDDKEALAKFYVWFIAIITFTVLSQYILTRYKTRTQYKQSLVRKLEIHKVLMEKDKPRELPKPILETKEKESN